MHEKPVIVPTEFKLSRAPALVRTGIPSTEGESLISQGRTWEEALHKQASVWGLWKGF